jgi:hypothetical protein
LEGSIPSPRRGWKSRVWVAAAGLEEAQPKIQALVFMLDN